MDWNQILQRILFLHHKHPADIWAALNSSLCVFEMGATVFPVWFSGIFISICWFCAARYRKCCRGKKCNSYTVALDIFNLSVPLGSGVATLCAGRSSRYSLLGNEAAHKHPKVVKPHFFSQYVRLEGVSFRPVSDLLEEVFEGRVSVAHFWF